MAEGAFMQGTCVTGGMHAGETPTEAGGMRPIGMDSCVFPIL